MSRRSKKRNLNKLKLRNSTRVSLVMLSLVVFSISSANFYNSIFKNNITKIEEDVYTYTNEYKSDYSVNIKENPFIEETSLPAGQTYVSDLVDSLDMNLNYKYSATQPSTINYTYKIDAVLGASYSDNGEEYSVWNKTYNLKTSEAMQADNTIQIAETINIDYDKYHNEVKNFKQTMGMSLESFLYIKLTVNTNANVNNQEAKNEYVSNFSISLGDKIAIVDGKTEDTQIGSIKQENKISYRNIDKSKMLLSLITIIICLYIIYYIRFKTKKFNPIRNEFKLELNRILKSCQDRIVIVKNQVETDEENIIDVKDFGELIKLSEELYKPILCWISDDLNNEQAWFSIISNKIKYRFILKK